MILFKTICDTEKQFQLVLVHIRNIFIMGKRQNIKIINIIQVFDKKGLNSLGSPIHLLQLLNIFSYMEIVTYNKLVSIFYIMII